MSATAELARFCAEGSFDAIPEAARAAAKTLILDTLGVTLAGAASDGTRIVQQWVSDMGSRPEAQLIGSNIRAAAAMAAFANGCAGHALDYDDTILFSTNASTFGTRLHPSTPTLAAALAVAEQRNASGRDLLSAFVYGYEATCRVANACNRELYVRGYHPTGVIAPLGAAVAAGRLLGLDQIGLQRALGLAATCGGGLRANYGTMTKPFHAGHASQTGVMAASLAARGFSASEHVLEERHGFFTAFANGFDAGLLLDHLGAPLYVEWPGSAIKPYPTGSLTHAALDVAFDLLRTHAIEPGDVEHVAVGSNSNLFGSLIHGDARDGLEAKFSMPACMALAFVERRVGIAQLSDTVVGRPDIQTFMRKVELYVEPELEALGFDQPRALVNIRLTDGRVFSGRADEPKPLHREQLIGKFSDCAALVLQPEQAQAIVELIDGLEDEPDTERLARLLRMS